MSGMEDRVQVDRARGEGEVELPSGRWHWYDVPIAAPGEGGVAVRTLIFTGAEQHTDIMRRMLPGDHPELDDAAVEDLGRRPDERECMTSAGRCFVREHPGADGGPRKLDLHLAAGASATVPSPGGRFLGEIPRAEIEEIAVRELTSNPSD